jgi:hypothetical protein
MMVWTGLVSVGYEVLMALRFNTTIVYDVTPCGLVVRYKHFEGSSCLNLWGRRIAD